MLVLKNTLNLEQAESAVAWLYANPKDSELAFPTKVRQRELAGDAAFVQFLLTWAQLHQRKSLLSAYVPPQDLEAARSFVGSLSGLVAALVAQQATDHTSKRAIRTELLAAAFEKLSALTSSRPWTGSKGLGLEILCVDHFDLGEPPVFYENGSIRGELWFRDVAPLLIGQSTPPAYRNNIGRKFSQELGSVIYELLQNTEHHAKTTISGDSVTPSVRGLTIRHRSISRQELMQRAGDDHAFNLYAEKLPQPPDGYQHDKFLEISIFDAGPGYASRWTGADVQDLTVEEEFSALSACFAKGASTRRGSHYGQGLPYVIAKLKSLDGLFRVRSGRLSLFADLNADAILENGAPRFRDTSGGLITARPRVAGALVSAFIPVGAI